MLKDMGIALEIAGPKRKPKTSLNLGIPGKWVSSAPAGTEGHGMDEALLTWFAGCW